MYMDDSSMLQLATLFIQVYLTLAIMGIGFGMMLGGPDGASAVARFFFLRPLVHLAATTAGMVAALLSASGSSVLKIVAVVGRAARRELDELRADVRWLLQKFARR
jgi:tellurite resistance protein TehA-like permease